MKKNWLAVGFISAYLGVMSFGIFAHAVSFMQVAHPGMYYVVWDMFCGWSAFSTRYHVIAEGESGQWYDVGEAPWGEFRPFGHLTRRHYDTLSGHAPRIALNTLAHTDHEPITRVFLVEENWAKKYNMPDHLWAQRYHEPKPDDFTRYHRVRRVFTADGRMLHGYTNWHEYQALLALSDNPRLIADMQRGRSYYAPPQRWMPQVSEQTLADNNRTDRGAVGNAN